MATNKQLEQRIAELEAAIARLTGVVPRATPIEPENLADRVPRGSVRHMAFLGLREAMDEDKAESKYQGYALTDDTLFGVNVRPEFLRSVLMQKVHELTYPMPVPQSVDPRLPDYAPPLWQPNDIPVRGIV